MSTENVRDELRGIKIHEKKHDLLVLFVFDQHHLGPYQKCRVSESMDILDQELWDRCHPSVI